jgi:ribosomal protein L15E
VATPLIVEKVNQRAREFFDVILIDQTACAIVDDHVTRRIVNRSNARASMRHRFEIDEAEPFTSAGQRKERGLFV